MSTIIRRSLTTIPQAGPSTPSLLLTAPQAVRHRREEAAIRAGTLPPHTNSKAKIPRTLPPRSEQEFQTLRSQGQYKGDEASGRKVFWERQVQWRSRLRGVSKAKKADFISSDPSEEVIDGETNTEVTSTGIVGQRIYLPNIQIRLMRNHTPPGTPYDPYTATFRIPHSMTKNDLRSYLSALYSFQPTFIRTDNYFAPTKRMPGGQIKTEVGSVKSYKRAIVGLEEPFHYPDDVEELSAKGRENGMGEIMADERKKWVEENFLVETMKGYRKKALMKFHKGYRWRGKTHDNEGNVMREIMKKRLAKENQLQAEVKKMHEQGQASEIATA